MSVIANLRKASFDRETITFGGGEFKAVDVFEEFIKMRDLLERTRNLINDGEGFSFIEVDGDKAMKIFNEINSLIR